MTPEYFATLTLKTWRASGARTEARRDSLLHDYLERYFGSSASWAREIAQLEISARLQLRKNTRIDELQYS